MLDILLKLARSENVGVLFSTHITSDLEKCASNILYIDNGNIIGKGSLSEFRIAIALHRSTPRNAPTHRSAEYAKPPTERALLSLPDQASVTLQRSTTS